MNMNMEMVLGLVFCRVVVSAEAAARGGELGPGLAASHAVRDEE